MRFKTRLAIVAALIAAFVVMVPAASNAQWRVGVGVGIHRGLYGYPYWGPYWSYWGGPFFWGGPWSPYGYGYPYQYPGRYRQADGAEVRLQVKPSDTQVYLDGYYMGVVSDFDGVFKHLPMTPGEHELVLYLKGYRTVKQTVRVSRGEDSKVKYTMVKLGAGETSEPPPVATPPPPEQGQTQPMRPRARRPGMPPPEPGQPPMPPNAPEPPQPPQPPQPGVPPGQPQADNFGSVAIRVQPAGAEILIDGQRWQGPDGPYPLVVQVAEGTHRIEVRKEGFVTFSSEITVRRGDTTPLNVSLPPRG